MNYKNKFWCGLFCIIIGVLLVSSFLHYTNFCSLNVLSLPMILFGAGLLIAGFSFLMFSIPEWRKEINSRNKAIDNLLKDYRGTDISLVFMAKLLLSHEDSIEKLQSTVKRLK